MKKVRTIKHIIPAGPGWVAVYADAESAKKYYTMPVVCWALIDTIGDPDDQEIIGQVAFDYAIDNAGDICSFVGYLGPGEDDKYIRLWAEDYLKKEREAAEKRGKETLQ